MAPLFIPCIHPNCSGNMTRTKLDGDAGTSSGVPNFSRLMHSKKYECIYDGCNKAYTSMNNLKIHLKAHQGKYDYKCDHEGCDKAFLTSYNLKVHRRSHTAEKPYSCELDGCDESFPTIRGLNTHMRVHSGERWGCAFNACSKQFTTRRDLNKHMRTHKEHQCKIDGCGKTFKAPHHLQTHMRIKHQQRDPTSSTTQEGGEEEGSSQPQQPTKQLSTNASSESSAALSSPSAILTPLANSQATQQLLESLSHDSSNWLSPFPGDLVSDSNPGSTSLTHPSPTGPVISNEIAITALSNESASSSSLPSGSMPPASPDQLALQQLQSQSLHSSLTSLQQNSAPLSAGPTPPYPLTTSQHMPPHPMPLTSEVTNVLLALQQLQSQCGLASLQQNSTPLSSGPAPPHPLTTSQHMPPHSMPLTSEIKNGVLALLALNSAALQSLLTLLQFQNTGKSTSPVQPPSQRTAGTAPSLSSLPTSTGLSSRRLDPAVSNFPHQGVDLSTQSPSGHMGVSPSLQSFPPPISTGSHDYPSGSHDIHAGSHGCPVPQSTNMISTFPHHSMSNSAIQSTSANMHSDGTFPLSQPIPINSHEDSLDHGMQTIPNDLDSLLFSPYAPVDNLAHTAQLLGHSDMMEQPPLLPHQSPGDIMQQHTTSGFAAVSNAHFDDCSH